MSEEKQDWPRIRDLPNKERFAFRKFLTGQTCPYDPELGEESDLYYPWDYENFKLKHKPEDRFFD